MTTSPTWPCHTAAEPPAGLRERKKDSTRRALAEGALALALDRGYQAFTISELVEQVGVSRRTFSNYFASKAECVAAVTDGWLDDVLDAIRQAPAGSDFRQVLHAGLVEVARHGTDRWGRLQPLVEAEPELAAQVLATDERIVDLAAVEIARRSSAAVDDIRVRLLASFAVTAGREVLARWSDSDDRSETELGRLLTVAFSVVNPGALQIGDIPTPRGAA